ncbi:MAG: hypothetical protein FWD31_01510, partial [Planctomycetaceae bacterium]|nr:hypothetical protein [Planctomycetaceae bacterium]
MLPFLSRFIGSSENVRGSRNPRHKSRKLQYEPLEERALLAVNPVPSEVWSEVTAKYSDLNWMDIGDYNYIEITSDELSSFSLRNAMTHAGTTPENDLIVVRTTDTQNKITLEGTELLINIDAKEFGSVTIVSLGEERLTVDGDQQSRVFNIASGSEAAFAGLTITGGLAEDTDEIYGDKYLGGGIHNAGTLIVANCMVSGNHAIAGGGIANFGTLTVTNSMIVENTTGFYHDVGGPGTVGGGIANYDTLTVTNSTICFNTSSWSGGGIFSSSSSTSTTLYNTIVVFNHSVNWTDIDAFWETMVVDGSNNLGTFTDWSNDSGENFLYDPELPLFVDAENGDYRLARNSQAIDKGSNDYVASEFDLDGKSRISGNTVDIGAYEYQYAPAELVVSDITMPQEAVAGTSIDVAWVIANTDELAADQSRVINIYLSTGDQTGDDILVGTFDDSDVIDPDANITLTGQITIPLGNIGTF